MGYETYQKVFTEAVEELKTGEFAHIYTGDGEGEAGSTSGHFVVETQVESDLELSFPSTYVPLDSERILLYRELDSLTDDKALEAFRTRMEDRFGKLPASAHALTLIPHLRRLGQLLAL